MEFKTSKRFGDVSEVEIIKVGCEELLKIFDASTFTTVPIWSEELVSENCGYRCELLEAERIKNKNQKETIQHAREIESDRRKQIVKKIEDDIQIITSSISILREDIKETVPSDDKRINEQNEERDFLLEKSSLALERLEFNLDILL